MTTGVDIGSGSVRSARASGGTGSPVNPIAIF